MAAEKKNVEVDEAKQEEYKCKKTQTDFLKQTFWVEGVKSPLTVLKDYEGEIKKILKKLLEGKSIKS